MISNLYLDIHVLQDVPPANLNRDDSGSPKSARYGGVDRLRVSSQAWKRATRKHFADEMDKASLGMRTRRVTQVLRQTLEAHQVPREVSEAVVPALLKQIKITEGKKEGDSAYLFFFSRPQMAALAEAVAGRQDLWDDPQALSDAIDVPAVLGSGHSLDVALFGRMVADLPDLNVDAAAQVSHALATHAAPTQFDYFTAVDDAQTGAEPAAGMIGTVEFNSATLYRYATVNIPGLIDNMDDREAAVQGVAQFMRSFVLSMPSGKQNTFAAHTRPALVWFVLRADQPVNYISAFEKPVRAGMEGYVAGSLEALATFAGAEGTRWGDEPLAMAATYGGQELAEAFGPAQPFDQAVASMRVAIDDALGHE